MPYLQLDVNGTFPVSQKKALATRMRDSYAALMKVDASRISIAVRECGEGAVWRTVGGELVPVSLLMLDIRRGRPAELRMAVARQLVADCCEVLGLREDRLNVEFTQHAGDEMYHPTLGGYSPECTAAES